METNPEVALAQVRALQPNVVLVEGDGTSGDSTLMAALTRMVYENEKLRIVRLNLTQKELNIYQQEHRQLVNTQDLVAAIRV
jgi:Flp pilus assembly CpaF family ATPase